jgi:hypothetical protein
MLSKQIPSNRVRTPTADRHCANEGALNSKEVGFAASLQQHHEDLCCQQYLDQDSGAGANVWLLPKMQTCSVPGKKHNDKHQQFDCFNDLCTSKLASERADLACLELIETRDKR